MVERNRFTRTFDERSQRDQHLKVLQGWQDPGHGDLYL
jgi:hypothetical protein